ncbi:ArsR/SmtB family transcription factor [Rhodococcus koreensis]|uniref:ArsR/SmtB family transcription factor n=1 Tax=Rhodococcus koreensis TaxID=99653 RepID=UPI00197D324B|nr:metalloregulator ArsR/SmtB family transcription factor [Rhodococcus koreensis]QSE86935.1 helix-turn-helix transcriptional regulator [Rhodococcus koreensis]
MARDAPVPLDTQVELFKAMADPVRLDLLKRIASVPEMACTDLVEESHVAKSTVSYHMKALRTAGLIEVRKEGRNFHYTYRPDAMKMLASTLGEIGR